MDAMAQCDQKAPLFLRLPGGIIAREGCCKYPSLTMPVASSSFALAVVIIACAECDGSATATATRLLPEDGRFPPAPPARRAFMLSLEDKSPARADTFFLPPTPSPLMPAPDVDALALPAAFFCRAAILSLTERGRSEDITSHHSRGFMLCTLKRRGYGRDRPLLI